MRAPHFRSLALLVFLASLVFACNLPTSTPTPNPSASPPLHGSNNITVSWNANHETAVNRAGGGYRVYYSITSPVGTSGGNYINVPYQSGTLAPTSATVKSLPNGTLYFRVVAYSAFNPPGGSSGSVSSDSAEVSITVP